MRSAVIVGLGTLLATGLLWMWGVAWAGEHVYPLDDAYIHMAMADTWAQTGTWGLGPGGFASATSSPVWVVVLGVGSWILGSSHTAPLVLSAASAVGAVGAAHGLLRGLAVSARRTLWILAVVALATPLPVLVIQGMEHALHAALVLLFVEAALVNSTAGRRRRALALAFVLPLVRYESLWVVAACAAVVATSPRDSRDRHWALAWVGASALGPLMYGLWSVHHGAWWVPNSLVMKSAVSVDPWALWRTNLWEGVSLWGLALLAVPLGVQTPSGPLRRGLVAFVLAAAAHLTMSRVGWYYRYEAYLVCWGLCFVGAGVMQAKPWKVGWAGALLVLVALGWRTTSAVVEYPKRSLWTARTDCAMADFVSRGLPPGTVVALHDVGCVAWRTDAPLVDVAGLGTDAVAHLSRQKRFTGTRIAALAAERGARVGLVSDAWMDHDRPPGWQRVGGLVAVGPDGSQSRHTGVFALDVERVAPLREALADYGEHAGVGVGTWLDEEGL